MPTTCSRHQLDQTACLNTSDHDQEAGERQRSSVVRPAQRSPAAQKKAASKRTADDLPVHSFRSLIADLGTLTVNVATHGTCDFERNYMSLRNLPNILPWNFGLRRGGTTVKPAWAGRPPTYRRAAAPVPVSR